jgi:hypothetical protein
MPQEQFWEAVTDVWNLILSQLLHHSCQHEMVLAAASEQAAAAGLARLVPGLLVNEHAPSLIPTWSELYVVPGGCQTAALPQPADPVTNPWQTDQSGGVSALTTRFNPAASSEQAGYKSFTTEVKHICLNLAVWRDLQ